MSNLNICIFQGRLTADPELKSVNSNDVTNFSIAVDRFVKEGPKKADFINCSAWNGTASFITKYFQRGDPILITGELQSREYTDKNDQKRTAWEIRVNKAYFGGSKRDKSDYSETYPIDQQIRAEIVLNESDEDDLPF